MEQIPTRYNVVPIFLLNYNFVCALCTFYKKEGNKKVIINKTNKRTINGFSRAKGTSSPNTGNRIQTTLYHDVHFKENGGILLVEGANKAKFNHSFVVKTFQKKCSYSDNNFFSIMIEKGIILSMRPKKVVTLLESNKELFFNNK